MKNSLALCMIVKNEAHIIKETLTDLCQKIEYDYWVISDTGSTDDTKEIITEFFREKGIPGELHEDEWKDFGHNRSLVFEHASKCASRFMMIFDADDRILGTPDFPDLEKLCHPTKPTQFMLPIGTVLTYSRPFIFDNKHKWKFCGVLHEYPWPLDDQDPYTGMITGNFALDSRRLGDRSKDPLKYKKDAIIMEKALEEEIEKKGPLVRRYTFYTAQSYRDCKEHDKAIKYYLQRANMEGYDEEVYTSFLYAGRSMVAMNLDEKLIEDTFLKGWNSMKDRSECLFELAHYFNSKQNYTKGYLYSSEGVKIPYPKHRNLFVEKIIFDVHIKNEYASACFHLQKFTECFKSNSEILRYTITENLIKNQKLCSIPLRQFAIQPKTFKFTKPKTRYYGVTLTMTSCKRFDLFEQTVNSLLNNVKDLYMIERFICIDDNSSNEDRKKMLEKYPFFEYTFKKPEQKGHVSSMNLIKKKLTPEDRFIFHLEDDWVFLTRKNYIGESIRVLKDNDLLGQVLFNRNYAETVEDYVIEGGKPFHDDKFLLHEFEADPSKTKYKVSCEYWPHFSFRPSIFKKEVLDVVGNFENVKHFEMDYARRYVIKGFASVFHNRIDMMHIGKLVKQQGENAYSLNGISQFG